MSHPKDEVRDGVCWSAVAESLSPRTAEATWTVSRATCGDIREDGRQRNEDFAEH